jgi:putative hydrolase of the HAD superfamily
MKVEAVLFDLDDTLYEERQFVRSGFQAVASRLAEGGIGPADEVVQRLEYFHHAEGRAQVLQKLAAVLNFSPDWIPELVEVFRSHRPTIELPPDTREVLPRLRQRFRLGCVTDGWAAVQHAKVTTLGLRAMLDAVVIADDFGPSHWKPDPFPLLRCCELLGVAPAEAVYVGDNPERDMAGAAQAGMRSIRIRRATGYFSRRDFEGDHLQAEVEVRDLWEVESWLRGNSVGSDAGTRGG